MSHRFFHLFRVLAIGLLMMPLVACSRKTAWDIADQNRQAIEQLEFELAGLKDSFPSEKFDWIDGPLDPLPYFHLSLIHISEPTRPY